MSGQEAVLAEYVFRRSVLETARRYVVFADRLEIHGGGSPVTTTHFLSDVKGIRLKYEHTKQREYYECRIKLARGSVDLRHVSWFAFGKFEDRRETYTPFVKTLLTQLANQTNVDFRGGSMANFIGALIGIPVMATLAAICVTMGKYGLAVLALFFLTLCGWMLGPSRPRRFDPRKPPEDLLPQ
jgi:hypothetical protein